MAASLASRGGGSTRCPAVTPSDGTDERWLTGQHLIEHAAEAVDIAPAIEARMPGNLLRAHVIRRASGFTRQRPIGPANGTDGARDAEIGHYGVGTLEQDVFGLDVSMDDVVTVSIRECLSHFAGDTDRFVYR